MATDCAACGEKILDLNFLECILCEKLYDNKCLNIKTEELEKMSQEQKETWLCPECMCKEKRPVGDRTNTPVRALGSTAAPAGPLNNTFTMNNNINKVRGSGNRLEPVDNSGTTTTPKNTDIDLSTILSEIRNLQKEVSGLKIEVSQVSATLTDYLTKTDAATQEITLLKSSLFQLELKIAHQEQQSMIKEVEIIGLPEHSHENLVHIAMTTAQKVGVELTENDIDQVARIGPKRGSDSNKSRPVILTLVRRLKRDQLIKSAKSRRNLTSEGIVEGKNSDIYLNERLTKNNRNLFREARLRAKQHNFRYCWSHNGSIYVRRAEGHNAIRIDCISVLDEKVGPQPRASTNSKDEHGNGKSC
ncbi:hypothetical protein O0L34_g5137 [Tuta absoluta]|nr:hypothetical protein O0L34_g5137 [Tuta absoluta]